MEVEKAVVRNRGQIGRQVTMVAFFVPSEPQLPTGPMAVCLGKQDFDFPPERIDVSGRPRGDSAAVDYEPSR